MNFLPKHLLLLLATIIIISNGCGEHTPEWIPQPNASELISEPRLLHTVKIAQKAVVKDPKSAITWGKLGHVYYIHGWRVEAAQCYRHAVELEPDEFSWFYYLGRSLDEIKPDEAADALAKSIALNPEYPPAHMAYARVLMALREFEQARQHFERAAELDPQEPLAELGLGELALKAKQLETARDHLQKALTLEPQQKEAHSALSQVYMALGDKEVASRHARLAQKFVKGKLLNDPLLGKLQGYGATASWFAIRGGLLLRSGDFKRAAAQFKVAASGAPKNSTIWLDYGAALLGLKRYQEALEALECALATREEKEDKHQFTSKNMLRLYITLSVVYEKVGDTKSSEKYLQKALSFNPISSEENWSATRGYLFLQAGYLSHAIAQFEVTISEDEKSPNAWLGHGTTLLALKRYQDAITALERALNATRDEDYKYNISVKNMGELYINLGIAYMRVSDVKSSEQYLKQALTLNPVPARAINALAVLYYSQGRLFDALTVLQSEPEVQTNVKTLYMRAKILRELHMHSEAESVETELRKVAGERGVELPW